jgi:hypothetical protein
MTDSSDDILTDEDIERLKNEKGGREFGAGSNIISGGNLPNIDYGNIAGQIFALQPNNLNLGIDLNANKDALDALVDAGLVSMPLDVGGFGGSGGTLSSTLSSNQQDKLTKLAAEARDSINYDKALEAWIAAGEELEGFNRVGFRPPVTDSQFDEEMDDFFTEQKILQDDLQKARADFIAAGGDPDGLAQAAAAAAATGIAGIANVIPQVAGAGTFQQVKVTPGTITGTFDPKGPQPLIPIGKDGNTTVVTTTGVAAVDDAINAALDNQSVAEAGVPTLGDITTATGDLINKGLENVGVDTLAGDADKSTEGTDVVVGGAGTTTIAGGAGTDTIAGGAGTDTIAGGAGTDTIAGGAGTDTLKGTVAARDMTGSVAPQVGGQVDVSNAVKGGLGTITTTDGVSALDVKGSVSPYDIATTKGVDNLDVKSSIAPYGIATTDGVSALDVKGSINPYEYETTGEIKSDDVKGGGGSNRGGGNAGLSLPQSFRGIKEEPGDLVDIDYLYDFDDGLEQLFAATEDEEEIEKGLYVYEEGGEVAKQDAVDVVTRRPGEYGRNYFTQGEGTGFIPTGTALGGESLTSSEIQIPKYTYERDLLPQFSGPVGQSSIGQSGISSVVSADPVGAGLGTVDQTQQRSPFYDADTLSNLFNSFSSIFGGGGGGGEGSAATGSNAVATTPTTETVYTTEVVADPLKDYLSSLGYGTSAKSITKDDIAAFKNQDSFSLDDIAGALGTSQDVLNQIYNFEPTPATTTTVADPLKDFLSSLGYGTSAKSITKDDIAAFKDQNVFSLDDIAGALGTSQDVLNQIYNFEPTQATTTTVADPLKDFLSSLGYGTSAKSITKDDIAAFKGQNAFSLDDIASALGTSEDVLNQIYNFEPTEATTTVTQAQGTGPTALQQYLLDQGFGAQKDITKDDITAFASSGFDMGDIASALGVTANDLQAVANYTAPAPADDAALYEFLKDLGFVGATKEVTKDDADAAEVFLADNPQFSKADMAAMLGITEYAQGGMTQGYYLGGPTDGMADLIPATIDGTQPAALSDGEFVIPADVVSHLGNGNSDAGAKQLYSMMDRVRDERTGTTKQGPEIDPTKMMPA